MTVGPPVALGADLPGRLPGKELAGRFVSVCFAGDMIFRRPMGVMAGSARYGAVLILQSEIVKKRQSRCVFWPDRQGMLRSRQTGFACDIALAVTA